MNATRCRPDHWLALLIGYGVALVGFFGIAHESGSGWVQAVGAIIAGTLLIGTLAPWVVLRRLRVTCTQSPADAIAGIPFSIELSTTASVLLEPILPAGERLPVPAPGKHRIKFTASRRGAYSIARLRASTSFPFGIVRWSKTVDVDLRQRLFIAPRMGTLLPINELASKGTSLGKGRSISAPSGDLRSIREYKPGDRRSKVHWPATARSNALVVRESEESHDPRLIHIDAILAKDRLAAEESASNLLATIISLMSHGVSVELRTKNADGSMQCSIVKSPQDARRRMAQAEAFDKSTAIGQRVENLKIPSGADGSVEISGAALPLPGMSS